MAQPSGIKDNFRGERVILEAVPLIDMEALRLGNDAKRRKVASAMADACQQIGFFYVKGHGVPQPLVGRTFAEARRFFAASETIKTEIAIERSPCHRGYFAMGGENLDPAKQADSGDLKEGLKIGRDLGEDHPLVVARLPLHGPNQWPQLPGWQGAIQTYFDEMTNLGRLLMRGFALALELDECFFDPLLTEPMPTLGPLHYPPQSGTITDACIGAGAHTDFGCLTILAQDENDGLQVKNAAGKWLNAPPIADTFVINIGDMMARWTNDRFASAEHRVINRSANDRYSIPFFFDPNFHADLTVLESCVATDETPKYPPTTAGQHLLDKINQSFDYHRHRQGEGT